MKQELTASIRPIVLIWSPTSNVYFTIFVNTTVVIMKYYIN